MALARPLAVTALLLLLTPALAGCLSDGTLVPQRSDGAEAAVASLSEPRYEIADPQAVWIQASSDDAEMFAKLWLPEGAPDGSVPLILVMTPYQGYDGREEPLDATSRPSGEDYTWLIDHFVPRGYGVAFLDVRGTGESGGCLEQTAQMQRQDGYDAVVHFTEQDWSNGLVGMYGRSYRAETQLGTASLAPPGLATIVPVASVAGQYEWNYYEGVPFTLHTLLGNALYLASEGAQPSTEPKGIAQYPSKWACQPEILTQDATHTGDWDAYWEARELRKLVDSFQGTSMLYVHGLQDWNVRSVAIRDMYEHVPTEKRLILGQWSHAYPDNGYGQEPRREDWRTLVHLWYDHFLLDSRNGILDRLPPVQVQDSEGRWRAEATFPPHGTDPVTLHLTPDNQLVPAAPTPWEAPLTFRENEEAFLRNNTGLPVPSADTGEVQEQLVFTSQALPATLHVTGWPTLSLDIELFDGLYPDPDQEIDAHFAANLHLVDEEGETTWLNAAYLSARHKDGVEHPSPILEDERVVYELVFHPQDTVVPAGSQLQLVISASDRWTEPQGSGFGANLFAGQLTLDTIAPLADDEGMAVPLVEPVVPPAPDG